MDYAPETFDLDVEEAVNTFFNSYVSTLNKKNVLCILRKYAQNLSDLTIQNILFVASLLTDFNACIITDLDEVIFNSTDENQQQIPLFQVNKHVMDICKHVPFCAALTTRLQITQVSTEDELAEAIDVYLPVITRPQKVPVDNTCCWKFAMLKILVELTGKKLFMLDDSLSLYNFIRAQNHPKIKGILFRGSQTPNHKAGVNWRELTQKIQDMVG
ncbi:MAG: hypothetical protein LBG64_02535 [Pseudomonadales bacterium]|jgi:hypothetical protein|nr:hypothetical protein [Pseudomonadales bacterium]